MFHRSHHFVQELNANTLSSETGTKVLASNSQPVGRAITPYNSPLISDWYELMMRYLPLSSIIWRILSLNASCFIRLSKDMCMRQRQ